MNITTFKKKMSWGILSSFFIILLFLNFTLPLDIENNKTTNEFGDLKSQTIEIPVITDNIGQEWHFVAGMRLEVEDTQVLKISAEWEQNINSSIIIEELLYDQSWIFVEKISSDTNNTKFSNFSFVLDHSSMQERGRRFEIRVFDPVSGDLLKDTEKQEYTIENKQSPSFTGSPSDVLYSSIYDEIKEEIGISIDWTGLFTDNVGIEYYELSRKRKFDDNTQNTITESDFNEFIIAEIYDSSSYVDFEADKTRTYYYAVRAVDYIGQKSDICYIPSSLRKDIEPPQIDIENLEFRFNQSSNILKNPDNVLVYGGSQFQLRFPLEDNDLETASFSIIYLETGNVVHSGSLSPESATNLIWSSALITLTESRYLEGNYSIEITMKDTMNNENSYIIEQAFTIKHFREEVPETNWMLMGIIIGTVAAILIVGFVLYKKRKVDVEDDSDIEFSKQRVRKKKGEIYQGASSIGRKSGQAADLLQSQRGKEDKSKKKSQKKSAPSPQIKNNSSTVSREETSRPPRQASIEQIDLNVDSKPSSMKIAQQERKVDLERRMGFLDSKIDSLNQNLELTKIILNEMVKSSQITKICEKCEQNINEGLEECPYCTLETKSEDLKQKEKEIEKFGKSMICSKCNKIMDPSWSQCPYCFIEENQE